MEKDAGLELKELMTDGGITANHFVMQFLADLLNKKVMTIGMPDVSALGAGYLAGLTVGLYPGIEAIGKLNASKDAYLPAPGTNVQSFYKGWQRAISH